MTVPRNDAQLVLVGKKVGITPLFKRCGILTPTLEIIETLGMYPYKEKIEDNWAYFTAMGMKRLKDILDAEGKRVQHIAIVGICSGVEGIAPDLSKLIFSMRKLAKMPVKSNFLTEVAVLRVI